MGVGVENSWGTHVRHSFTSEPCPRSARVFRWCISEENKAWQRWTTPVPRAINMLTLAMRREHDDPKGDGHAQQRPREGSAAATGGGNGGCSGAADSDEFVDILQVQQLLLDSGGAGPTNGGRGRGRGREPPPPRLLDASAFAAPSYYYGSYGTHLTPPATSVDDLVALWFAGPSTSGAFLTSLWSMSYASCPFIVSRANISTPPSHHLLVVGIF